MIVELVDLSKWKKQKEILDELYIKFNINISSRTWRSEVEKWNKKWGEGEVDYCVTHSPKLGFKATNVYQEALVGVQDYNSRIINMSRSKRNMIQGFAKKNNMKINLETGEVE